MIRKILSLLITLPLFYGAAHGQETNPPAVKVEKDMALISPSAANSTYNTNITHTDSFLSSKPNEFAALGYALGKDRIGKNGFQSVDYIERAFLYVRNNIDITPIFGIQKGGFGALIDQHGTSFDQAELLVELLREGGISASYELGIISLSGVQFQNWLGAKTPRAACEILAGGAIPATVNGSTNCSVLSSSMSAGYTVEMMHIWVVANGIRYDPSYKKYIEYPGIDLGAAIGCGNTCDEQTISSLLSNISSSTVSGYDLATHSTKLNDLSISLLKHLVDDVNGLTEKTIEEIIGGREIDQDNQIGFGENLSYSLSAMRSWTDSIPDVFRAKLRIRYETIDISYYTDDIFGKQIIVYPTAISTIHVGPLAPGPHNLKPYLSIDGIITGDFPVYPLQSTLKKLQLNVERPYIDHEYAHEYFDRDLTLLSVNLSNSAFRIRPFSIIHGWGDTNGGQESYIAKKNADTGLFHTDREKNICNVVAAPTNQIITSGSYQACVQNKTISTGRDLPGFGSKWLTETSHLLRMEAALTNTMMQHHGSVGFAFSDSEGSPGVQTGWSQINIESSLTISSMDSIEADRKAAIFATSAIMNGFESGAARRASRGSMLIISGQDLYRLAAICNIGLRHFSTGTSAAGLASSYKPARVELINQYLANGYDVVAPVDDYVQCVRDDDDSANNIDVFTQSPLLAYRADGGAIAYLSTQAGDNYPDTVILTKGGGRGGAPSFGEIGIPQSVREVDHAAKARLSLPEIDLASGRLQMTTEPDIVTGSGAFPYSLGLVRSYDSTRQTGGLGDDNDLEITVAVSPSGGGQGGNSTGVAAATGEKKIGLGWSHNYDIKATPISDVGLGLGTQSPINAVEAITALHTANELMRAHWSLDRITTLTYTSLWINRRLFENAVSITNGGSSTTYTRLPYDSCLNQLTPNIIDVTDGDICFTAPPSGFGTLKQSGAGQSRTQTSRQQGQYLAWDTLDVSYELVMADGQKMYFDQSARESNVEQYKPISKWTFPSGMELTFCYTKGNDCDIFDELVTGEVPNLNQTVNDGTLGTQLYKVQNNIGRSLSFDYDADSKIIVTDDVGRTVEYEFKNVEFENSQGYSTRYERVLSSVTDPQGNVMTYRYTNDSFRLVPADIIYDPDTQESQSGASVDEFNVYLSEIYVPSDQDNPFVKIEYDDLWRVKSTTNATGLTTVYYPLSLGTEKWRFGEMIINPDDPDRIISKMWFNEAGQPTLDISPIGAETRRHYNGKNELIEVIYPEGNRTTAQYDQKGNVTQITNYPKPSSGETPLEIEASYDPLWNSLAKVSDAKGNATDITYNAKGLVQSVTTPPDSDGVRAVSTYNYTPIGQVESISGPEGLKTCFFYDEENNYSLLEETASCEPGGFTLKTLLSVDAIGNITDVDGPRTDVSDTSNVVFDDLRRPVIITDTDPDGPGPLVAPVTVNVYDDDGLMIKSCTLAQEAVLPPDPVASCAASTGSAQ